MITTAKSGYTEYLLITDTQSRQYGSKPYAIISNAAIAATLDYVKAHGLRLLDARPGVIVDALGTTVPLDWDQFLELREQLNIRPIR